MVAQKPSSLPPIIFPVLSKLTPPAGHFPLKETALHVPIRIKATPRFKSLFLHNSSSLQVNLKFGQLFIFSLILLIFQIHQTFQISQQIKSGTQFAFLPYIHFNQIIIPRIALCFPFDHHPWPVNNAFSSFPHLRRSNIHLVLLRCELRLQRST
ncbi:hypothetical protein ES288_A04G129800v1 [Gossypium darwinii]|uniref:Uncharacterized protein n=1 Tax=Gossypium darwinii TaxID=34276 RepID=A0A5D2GWZ4_GOSDA|nr:hypothetical protein ES288_A04G129800v1 [Gossypium darwinii]